MRKLEREYPILAKDRQHKESKTRRRRSLIILALVLAAAVFRLVVS